VHGAAGFLDAIAANRRRSFALLGAIFVLLWGVVFLLVAAYLKRIDAGGGVIALTAVAAYMLYAWMAAPATALRLNGAHRADGAEYAQLRNIVEGVAIAAGIPAPKVYVVRDPAPNAFAAGRDVRHGHVAVTTGLLEVMSRRELEGVVAHEIAHLKNRDIAIATLAVVAIGLIAALADAGLHAGRVSRGSRNSAGPAVVLVALGLYLVAVPLGMLLKAGLSRQREGLADATAVSITRNPTGLRSALEKLEADRTVVTHQTGATAHLWIESPNAKAGTGSMFGRFLDTHPPIGERIAQLRSYEGLDPEGRGPNDPGPVRQVTPSVPVGVAGWYTDPAGMDKSRYFDGYRWTNYLLVGGKVVDGTDYVGPPPPPGATPAR
jgi:heat shock protein HtpX